MSLSMVAGMPTVKQLVFLLKSNAPRKLPSPPITTNASTLFASKFLAAVSTPPGSSNPGHRSVCRMVPPCWMMPPTLRGVIRRYWFVKSPSQPRSKPRTQTPFECAILVTARMAAFIPGASPPEVTIPKVLTNTIQPVNATVRTRCKSIKTYRGTKQPNTPKLHDNINKKFNNTASGKQNT